MKQIVIISGKGGTGKTTTLASWAALAEAKALADCDVDAANLYLLLNPQVERHEEFYGAQIAVREEARCQRCGECERRCRFEAITVERISAAACEGCGLCVLACPAQALRLETIANGTLYVGKTAYGPLVYARLHPAGENSGRLVTRVRQETENIALAAGLPLILIDGAPGIGCTVNASLADTDLAVVVTEPTPSGRHDLERVVALARLLGVPLALITNKADINPHETAAIRAFCVEQQIPILAELPYDEEVMRANAQQRPLVEFSNGPVAQGLQQAWEKAADIIAGL